jgi:hypothetical protein
MSNVHLLLSNYRFTGIEQAVLAKAPHAVGFVGDAGVLDVDLASAEMRFASSWISRTCFVVEE